MKKVKNKDEISQKNVNLCLGGKLLLIGLAICFGFSAYKTVTELFGAHTEDKAFDELADIVERDSMDYKILSFTGQNCSRSSELMDSAENCDSPLPQYSALYNMNRDLFGWISIDDSKINYPVMYTPDRPEYYLRKAFDGSDSVSGVPFVDERCSADGDFFLVYGHNMKNRTMFAELLNYKKQSYFKEHPVINFDTLNEERKYVVIGAFYSQIYDDSTSDCFKYYEYADLSDEDTFDEYVSEVQKEAIYQTGIDAEYGDELLALSTCSYHTDNGRFVVVAKRIM